MDAFGCRRLYVPGAGREEHLKWHYKNLSYHTSLMRQQAPPSHQPGTQHATAADLAADLQQVSHNTRKVNDHSSRL